MPQSGAWTVVSAVVLGILLLAKFIASNKYKNLPPGPWGLPIIGSFHLLGKFPQQDFAKLAETYGPLMSLWLGPRLVVVVTSPAAAEEILKTQGSNFVDRIPSSFSDVLLPGDIVMASDSPVRRHFKKILHLQLSTSKQLQLAVNVRMEEIAHVMCMIPQDGVTVVAASRRQRQRPSSPPVALDDSDGHDDDVEGLGDDGYNKREPLSEDIELVRLSFN